MRSPLSLIGFASGIAGRDRDSGLGPWYLYYHPELLQLLQMPYHWQAILQAASLWQGIRILPELKVILRQLNEQVFAMVTEKQDFCVIGGDHSCAIGTWSAVAHAYRNKGDIGLIWIDAHMDSHTPETSSTQNFHGMPLAHLLGHGVKDFTCLMDDKPKLKPQNVCLIGIRSYEQAEAAFLADLGVKIFYMDDVHREGFESVLLQAYQHVTKTTIGYGLSLDLDAIEPSDAPGVSYREPNGIAAQAILQAFPVLNKEKCLGLEITEYDPMRDEHSKTAKLLIDIIRAVHATGL